MAPGALVLAIVLVLLGAGAVRNDQTWLGAVSFVLAGFAAGRALRRPAIQESPPSSPPIRSMPNDPQLHSVLAALGDGVLVLDAEDRVLAANPSARDLLPLRSHGSVAPLDEQVDWPQLANAMLEARRTRTAQHFEAARGENGGARVLAVSVSAPSPAGVLVVELRDQSRLRQLESHRRDFVANVSHELKTPLAAIQGFVETMIDDPEMPDSTRSRFLDRMQRQVQRLATLVSDLLTLSRLDEGGSASRQPCDLVAVAREVGRDLHPFAEQRGVALRFELPREACWVEAEREALRQVVSNLVDNGIKYTPVGGSVAVAVDEQDGEIELRVVDTGIGLAEEDQERVFERFYRVDKARSRELGGTGLGLSIVKNTVQTLGGSVGVRSRLGYGSTFWVRLPRLPGTPDRLDQSPASE